MTPEAAGGGPAPEMSAGDLAFLDRANLELSATLDFQRTADTITHLPVPQLCDWAALHVLGETELVETVSVHHHDAVRRLRVAEVTLSSQVRRDDRSACARAIRLGAPVAWPAPRRMDQDAGRDEDQEPDLTFAGGPDVGALLCVPLMARHRAIAVLTLVRDEPRPFGGDDANLAGQLASRAAMALDSAMLFSRERAAALTLQRSLLPGSIPPMAGTACAVRYLPGAAGLEVGGDWYDVIPLDHGWVGYVIGDVMGRGLQAAGVMGQMRSAVRAYAVEGHAPEEVLARVDRLLRMADEPPLVTCVYARLHPASGELCASSAGHLPPLLLRSDGRSEYLDLDPGLPLGVADTSFASSCVDMRAGDTLVLYSDGLVETPSTPLTVSLDELRDRAADLAVGHDVVTVADRLVTAFDRDAGHPDDIAVLVVRMIEERSERHAALVGSNSGLTLPPDPASVPKARAFVEEALAGLPLAVEVEDAKLLISELVTNALLHAGTVVHLQVEPRSDVVRLSVADEGPPDWSLPESPSQRMSVGGRGLAIVAVLARRWGVEALPRGKRVWFELPITSAG